MKKAFVILAVVLASSNGFAKGAKKKTVRRSKVPVTTIDAGGAPGPESRWPEITKKESL